MKWKIIADSGCDYRSLDNLAPDTEFVSVPLTIQVGETIYRDDAQLNIDQMMEEMYATTTASEVDLLVRKLNHLVAEGLDFDQVLDAITAYQAKTKLLFVLAKVDNLVKNGRLSKLVGTVVGLLNIRMVGEASKTGTLELLQKARGQKKAIKAAFDELIKAGYTGGHITIAHRNNDKFIEQFSALIREKFAQASIEVLPTSGLCSFYAEEGGLLMGYEI